jgi:hypothetical protein
VWVSDVERSNDSNQAVPWRPPLSLILVSVLAVGVAAPGAIAKEPVLAASASFASTVLELTEQRRGATAATQVQEVSRKRGLVLG